MSQAEDRAREAYEAWWASLTGTQQYYWHDKIDACEAAFLAGRASLEGEVERLKHEVERLTALFTFHGSVCPEDLDDAADIVGQENRYLARQLRLGAEDIRRALNPETSND